MSDDLQRLVPHPRVSLPQSKDLFKVYADFHLHLGVELRRAEELLETFSKKKDLLSCFGGLLVDRRQVVTVVSL